MSPRGQSAKSPAWIQGQAPRRRLQAVCRDTRYITSQLKHCLMATAGLVMLTRSRNQGSNASSAKVA
jgi:hypothetical protein